jgi:hypothetical protein
VRNDAGIPPALPGAPAGESEWGIECGGKRIEPCRKGFAF